MRDQPDGVALLDIARQVLREDVLPLLQPDQRLPVLMVVNALGIAERQLRAGDKPVQEQLQGLQDLLDGKAVPVELCQTPQAERLRLGRQLGMLIRSGKADPSTALHAPVAVHLREVALQTLLESNPKYLKKGA